MQVEDLIKSIELVIGQVKLECNDNCKDKRMCYSCPQSEAYNLAETIENIIIAWNGNQ